MTAVERACENPRAGKFCFGQIDDLVDRLLVVDADRDQARLLESGGAQNVEPGAVAVIDPKPEPRGDLDHVGIDIDRRDVDLLGKQMLRHDLSKAAKAD